MEGALALDRFNCMLCVSSTATATATTTTASLYTATLVHSRLLGKIKCLKCV